MEKRTILAFVLAFLILIMWSSLFGPKQEKPPQKEVVPEQAASKQVSEDTRVRTSPPDVTPKAPRKVAQLVVSRVEEKEIEVDTPLYRAVFTNTGPSIKSFKLKKYHQTTDADSPLIELVQLEKEGNAFLTANFDSSQTPKGRKTVYQTDETKIELKPESSPKDLVFSSKTAHGISVRQAFRFYPDQYRIDFTVDVLNESENSIGGNFSLDLRAMPPKEKQSYYSYVGLVLLLNNKLEEVEIEKPSEEKLLTGQIDWMAYENDFFISAACLDSSSKGSFNGRLLQSGVLEGTYKQPNISIEPSQRASSKYLLYLGPRDLGILKQFGKGLDKAINFGWTDIIAKPLLYALRFFNQYIHNYGVSIILLTILVKILFWPLTHKSYKSMKEMQKLQPMMAKLREKYKNNKEQLNKEMMGLYKTYKVNPMSGCLPMVIQIPVFFALFRILGSAIELRHAPFMLWINDLSAPDRLFHLPFQIPFMAPPCGIPVLTLLMGASMFIQQKMTPTAADPTQAKIMMFLPVIFTFMFINFPSGLVLYWLVNNILSIGQQYRIHRR